MKQSIKPQNAGALSLGHLFLEPFFAMLFLGVLGHHFHEYKAFSTFLFHFGYWNTFLAMLILQIVWPLGSPSWFDVKEEKE